MTPARPTVVFLPGQAAALGQQMRVARAMAAANEMRPVVLLSKPWPNEPEDGADGVRVVRLHAGGAPGRAGRENHESATAAGTRSWLGWLTKETLPAVRWRARGRAAALRAVAAQMAERLATEGAAALVVSSDRRSGPVLATLRAARDRGIRSVLVPYAYSHPVGSATIRMDRPIHNVDGPPLRSAKRYVADRFPRQVYESTGRRLLFYGPLGTLALHAAGQLPQSPWWAGGGMTDRVCVFSEAVADERVAAGIARERIVITGDVALDELHAAQRARDDIRAGIARDHGLDLDRPLVVFAVPQMAEQGIVPWPRHRKAIGDLARQTADANASVAVSLHPKSRREDYAFLDDVPNLRILDIPLSRAMAAADVSVAGRSSTVLWSIALGVPSIVVDFGWFGHDTWDDTDGVLVATDEEAFEEHLRGVLGDPTVREECRRGLAREAGRLTRFDGRATERTLAVIAEAAAQTFRAPTGAASVPGMTRDMP